MFKRKNNVGHVVQQHWVFGLYDVQEKKGYLRHVPDRTANSPIPIIQQIVIPGSIIHSDGWAAYNQLNNLGFHHLVVNHNEHFVDPVSGACTNHVESFWRRMKRRLKYISGSQNKMKWGHLDEALYRNWYGWRSETLWTNWTMFLDHISDIYPV